MEKNASQLFFMSDIENINQAINIYEKCDKIIPLKWSICTSTDILGINLEKFEKYLLSTFYLLINFFQKKYSRWGKHKTFDKKYKKKSFNFYLDQKNFRQEKTFFVEK